MPPDTSDYIRSNRALWDEMSVEYAAGGHRRWAMEPSWGVWNIPESELHLLPDVEGRDVVELGCGTAYISAWLARLGARRVVGLDNSPRQLATARTLRTEHGLGIALIQADAEMVPLRDALFDIAVSEYGASLWCDPHRWVPEAARLLRPGGTLLFLVNAPLHLLTLPEEDNLPADQTLKRDYFGLHRVEWDDDPGVEFHLTHGDWIRLLRNTGFDVVDLVELQPGPDATTRSPYVTLDWARRWPTEEVWIARRK